MHEGDRRVRLPMPFPYIFTFYSYKGGVGRSMAVMNVAYALAGRGRHVLLLDMDLEAPGLTGFLRRNQEFAPDADHRLDVLDLLGEAIRAASGGGTVKEKVANLPPVSNYIRPVAEERLASLRPRMGQLGRLDILGTDQSPKYFDRLAELDLRKLGHEGLVALSNLLHFYFKAQVFPHRPLGIENFEPPIQTPYDYVLVDSRTGMTEIGGLGVGPLADRLVVITSLNDQNVQGTLTFLQEAGIKTVPRPEGDEKWDDADTVRALGTENANLGPKPTIVVASPVPAGEIIYKRQRLGELEKQLGIRPVSLSYHPQMALMESVFVRDYLEEYLAIEYGMLATRVMALVGDDVVQMMSEAQRLVYDSRGAIVRAMRVASAVPQLGVALLKLCAERRPEGDVDPEVRQLYAFLSQIADDRRAALHNWGNALAHKAMTTTGEKADQFFEEAGRKYAEALRVKPDFPGALNNWGSALCNQAKTKTGEEAGQLFEEAGRKFAEALHLKPEYPEALNNWGTALCHQAKTKTGEEADRLFDEAHRKYAEASHRKPDHPEALDNWGCSLSEQAKTKTGGEADRRFEEAGRKFAEALRLKPNSPVVLRNWGSALAEQARRKTGEEADRLFEQAGRKYAEALRLDPSSPDPLFNWGNALCYQAETKTGETGFSLLAEAGRRYAEALQLRPDFPRALFNWANVLLNQAKSKTGEEADRYFDEAGKKYAEALRLQPGFWEALFNWGNALQYQAKKKTGEEADRLFEEAGRKFDAALQVKPDFPEALVNWGAALMSKAKRTSGHDADTLLRRARQKLLEAEQLRSGSGAYNLALLEAIQGNEAEASDWLRVWESTGRHPSPVDVEKDVKSLRHQPVCVSPSLPLAA